MATIKYDSQEGFYIASDCFELINLADEDKFKDYNDAWARQSWIEETEECGGLCIVRLNGYYHVAWRSYYESIAGYGNHRSELMDITHNI